MILTILKIIGTILLILVGILILLIFYVLLMPIRYAVRGQYIEKADLDVKISWIPLLFKLTAGYHDDTFLYVIKLFGGVVMTNTDVKISYLGRKFFSEEEEVPDKQEVMDEQKVSGEKEEKIPESADKASVSMEDKKISEDAKEKKERHPAHKKKISLIAKVREKIRECKKKIQRFIENLKKLNKKREDLLKVYHGKRFEIAKKDVILYVKRLFSIIKPNRLEGRVRFGLNDPASTGEVFGILALFLPFYDGHFVLQPEFETSCIEGNLYGKGKFSLFPIIMLALKVYFNKNLIKVVKRVQTIIER